MNALPLGKGVNALPLGTGVSQQSKERIIRLACDGDFVGLLGVNVARCKLTIAQALEVLK